MFQKILVYENVLADKHPALERALHLARSKEVELKLIDIVDSPSDALRELHHPMRTLVEQERKDRLYAMCDQLHERGIRFKTELIRGRPFVEIVREVVHEGFHLVIKTAALTEPNEVMGRMGPVDIRLVRNCPCPVWLEVAGQEVRNARILVAVDSQTEEEDLSNVLLAMGTWLAKTSGGELHVISAWEVPDEEFLAARMQPEKLSRYADDIRSAAQQRLDAMLIRAGKPVGPNNVHFRKGNAAKTILEDVAGYRPEVVVMGTVGHTNIRGLLIGNTADTVLRQINCPVLAVKPGSLFRA